MAKQMSGGRSADRASQRPRGELLENTEKLLHLIKGLDLASMSVLGEYDRKHNERPQ